LPAPKNEVFVLNRLLEDVCNLYTSEENMQLDLILPEEELSVFCASWPSQRAGGISTKRPADVTAKPLLK
jgi:hypothetical protein